MQNQDFTLIDKPLSVSEINTLIKKTFEASFFNLTIQGEISTFKPSANGHWYFTLKDETSQISAVMFRSAQYNLDFHPKNGDLVMVTGSIDVYAPRGTYQIICQKMKRAGQGSLLEEIEKRKAYYNSLGYFDEDKKKAIPLHPKTIGVITARTGAAIKDILDTTKRRAPSVDILLYPVLVQGESAAEAIALAIDMANEVPLCDVLIVGRGGGSIEDLLPFSEAIVIEAIHKSSIPIISAVGHEIDWALSDYVADKRAITPTDAAVIATEGVFQERENLHLMESTLRGLLETKVMKAERNLVAPELLESLIKAKANVHIPTAEDIRRTLQHRHDIALMHITYAFEGAEEQLLSREAKLRQRIKESVRNANAALREKHSISLSAFTLAEAAVSRNKKDIYQGKEQKLLLLKTELEALNPKNILSRGYAIVKDEKGKIVKDTKRLKPGERINITLHKGEVNAIIEGENK